MQQKATSSSRSLPNIVEQHNVQPLQASETDHNGIIKRKRRLRSGLPTTRGSVGTIADVPLSETMLEQTEVLSQERSKRRSGASVSPLSVATKKRKKRKSIGQNSRKKIRSTLPDTEATGPLGSSHISSRAQDGRLEPNLPDEEPILSEDAGIATLQGGSAIKSKRKKRKSIGNPPKARRQPLETLSSSSQFFHSSSVQDYSPPLKRPQGKQVGRKPGIVLAPIALDFENQVENEPTTARVSSVSQPKRRGRPSKPKLKLPAKILPKNLTTKLDDSRSHMSAKRHNRSPPKPKPKLDSIPITIHRFSKSYQLDDSDPLSTGPVPFPSRTTVSAIDVLSQICREIIAKSLSNLHPNTGINVLSQRKNAELKRKRKAVEMFGDELDERLFEVGEALDNNYALSTRLRQAKKRKILKREAYLEVRRRREEVAVEMDAVREKHEKATRIARDEEDLDTMVRDIELAVQRARAMQATGDEEKGAREGLEVRLRCVADQLSSAGGGGILERVKAFNALAEKAIGVL